MTGKRYVAQPNNNRAQTWVVYDRLVGRNVGSGGYTAAFAKDVARDCNASNSETWFTGKA